MTEQEELQKKYAEYALYKSQIEGLVQELSAVNTTSNELQMAKATLGNIKDLEESPEILVPIGGNSFLKGSIKDTKHVLTGIGAGVVVKKGISDAIDSIDKQLETLEDGRKKLEEQIKATGEKMGKLEPELQEMIAKAQTRDSGLRDSRSESAQVKAGKE